MKTADVIAVIALVVSSLLSIAALVMTIILGRKQEKLQKDLATSDGSLQQKIRDEVALSDRRRFFSTTLWDRIIGIKDIDPANPVGPDIRKAVNVLEAVAMAWETDTVDRDMVLVSFGHLYNNFYDKISRTVIVPAENNGSGPSGLDLLNSNPVIGKINRKILEEFQKRPKINA
jgi:hypothetical protein